MATDLQIELRARSIYERLRERVSGRPAWTDLPADDEMRLTAIQRASAQLENGSGA